MKHFLFLSLLILSFICRAQKIYYGGPVDSTTLTFEANDTLPHKIDGYSGLIKIDTTNVHLWRIGKSSKAFFASGGIDTSFAIMTDTLLPYPIRANDYFTLEIMQPPTNVIIEFVHKYQTTMGHDGGVVEFSIDTGKTWQNVKGDCNTDSFTYLPGVLTDNFYQKIDTLVTGEQSFSGTSIGWQKSRIQFFLSEGERLTGGPLGCKFMNTSIYIRFRFVSDTLADTLAGWIIDNLKIREDTYGLVPNIISYRTLNISPNPSATCFFTFPALNDEKNTLLEITNAIGQRLFTVPYTHKLDLSAYPKGLYLYKAVNSTEYYSGRLIVQ